MENGKKIDIIINEDLPLLLNRKNEKWVYGTVTLCLGGYIDIQSDCTISIDVLKKDSDTSGSGEGQKDIVLSGVPGEVGNVGMAGGTGGAGPKVTLTISDLQDDLYVSAFGGGRGGRGGRGSSGGNGGDSEPGGNGYGGDGGDGGRGGTGGNGGSGGELVLSYHSANHSIVHPSEECAPGGSGGSGGTGGNGGHGGNKELDGRAGRPGAGGGEGLPGKPGTITLKGNEKNEK